MLHGDVRIQNFVFAKTPDAKSFIIDFGRSLILDKSQTKQQDLLNQEMDNFKNLLFSTYKSGLAKRVVLYRPNRKISGSVKTQDKKICLKKIKTSVSKAKTVVYR